MSLLTEKQAFNAMVRFLERYYERTKSDDFGAFLSDLLHYEDAVTGERMTSDPAAWPQWLEDVQAVLFEAGST